MITFRGARPVEAKADGKIPADLKRLGAEPLQKFVEEYISKGILAVRVDSPPQKFASFKQRMADADQALEPDAQKIYHFTVASGKWLSHRDEILPALSEYLQTKGFDAKYSPRYEDVTITTKKPKDKATLDKMAERSLQAGLAK